MPLLPAFAIALMLQQGPTSDLPAKYKPAPPAASAVVARVNGVEIKAADVEGLLWEWRGFDAIQDLIAYEIIRGEAAKQNLDVSEKDVETAMNQALNQMKQNLPPGKTLEDALMESGFTRSRLFLRYRTQLLVAKIVERSFDPKKLVKISTIVFRPANEQTTALGDAIKRADAAYARLKKGDKWEDVVASSTTDSRVIATKGLIGWRTLTAFPDVVQKNLIELKPGQYTAPAQTENGIQIFRLEAAGASASAPEIEDARQFYMQQSPQPLFERLRKEAKIERLYPPVPGLNLQNHGN